MRLSKQSNYAIRALIYCAANPSGLSRIRDIGDAFGVSEMFLFKILVPIGRSGLLTTVRGRNGGVRLGAAADQITVMDVLRVTEEDFDLSECVRERCAHCPLTTHCRYETALSDALRAFTKVLESYTIADLVADRDAVVKTLGLTEPSKQDRVTWTTDNLAART
ncbi:Rrf2 family transcriptional regulator [Devosia sp. WQ 349]|uniref:Rrf2 family transcriptional regulator n=1 Tax=Devosia sp. WQ 349K1 TaxID=2800329 RepID=UPI0019071BB2|nr:Rrf2 family transcriptional regulator [Devosia sp. WQ 349K1]MBK1796183.1 Rrf2 family transcriptional regulator [Devosia sp. WQ 349K1]